MKTQRCGAHARARSTHRSSRPQGNSWLCIANIFISSIYPSTHHTSCITHETQQFVDEFIHSLVAFACCLLFCQPENVLITDDGDYKLCDFGSCTMQSRVYSTQADIALLEEQVQKYTTCTESQKSPKFVSHIYIYCYYIYIVIIQIYQCKQGAPQ